MRKARIENGVVAEILELTPFPPFHPDIIWVECGKEVTHGFSYDGSIFYAPLPKTTEQFRTEQIAKLPVLSPWKMRKALRKTNLLSSVKQIINQSPEEIQEAWEFALDFRRDDPLIAQFGVALGKTEEEIDQLFVLGATL